MINKTTHFENAVVPFPDVNEFLLGDFNNDGYMNLFQSVENDLKLATNIKVLIENGRKTIDYEDTTPVILRLLLDTTIPVITLLGESTVTLEIGQVYTDAGATAEDNYDGDITEAIVTVNNVDTSVVGTYTVTYNVSDANGNVAVEVTRTVNVESSLSVDDNIKNILKIYPNPVDDKLIIQGLQKKTKVSIYTILGKLVLSEMVSTEIDVSNLKTGIYLIKVTDIEGQLVRRFMKK